MWSGVPGTLGVASPSAPRAAFCIQTRVSGHSAVMRTITCAQRPNEVHKNLRMLAIHTEKSGDYGRGGSRAQTTGNHVNSCSAKQGDTGDGWTLGPLLWDQGLQARVPSPGLNGVQAPSSGVGGCRMWGAWPPPRGSVFADPRSSPHDQGVTEHLHPSPGAGIPPLLPPDPLPLNAELACHSLTYSTSRPLSPSTTIRTFHHPLSSNYLVSISNSLRTGGEYHFICQHVDSGPIQDPAIFELARVAQILIRPEGKTAECGAAAFCGFLPARKHDTRNNSDFPGF